MLTNKDVDEGLLKTDDAENAADQKDLEKRHSTSAHVISGATLDRQLTKEEIEEIEEAGEIAPPDSSLVNQTLLISAFAILGVYLRNVLTDATPAGQVSYLTSQFIGSFVIGLLFAVKDSVHVDLFVGLSVGFCGSLTTFSTWQLDIVETLVGTPGSPVDAGGKAYVWFQDQIIGFGVPFLGLMFGKHVSMSLLEFDWFNAWMVSHQSKTDRAKVEKSRRVVFVVAVVTAFAAWLGMILGACLVPGITTWSLIFAPFGAWLRFVLSRYLNVLSLRFYWGTLVANVFGSVIASILFVVMTSYSLDSLKCAALWAVEYGFCGSLTTVSTFVNELHTLPNVRDAYVYGVVSVLLTQILLIIIMGSFVWTQDDPFADSTVCFITK